MTHRQRIDPKAEALQAHGARNPNPEAVTDPLFQGGGFFDPRDRVQVKYEMLRRVRSDGQPVTQVAATFGVSRPTFYEAQATFEREGLAGLLPKKRGPRGGHKLTKEVLEFIAVCRSNKPSLKAEDLVDHVRERFGIKLHPRTIERAVQRQKKKRQ